MIRPDVLADHGDWLPLWDGCNAFHGREGPTALDPAVTETTWQRSVDPAEPVFALVAERPATRVGLVHFLHHRSTTRIELACDLQDLFTMPAARGLGVGRRLFEGVYAAAREAGVHRVDWQTHRTNAAGRKLYDAVAKHHGFIVYSCDV